MGFESRAGFSRITGLAEWLRKNPKRAPTPFTLEDAGQPSKMITFKALRVLRRIESAQWP